MPAFCCALMKVTTWYTQYVLREPGYIFESFHMDVAIVIYQKTFYTSVRIFSLTVTYMFNTGSIHLRVHIYLISIFLNNTYTYNCEEHEMDDVTNILISLITEYFGYIFISY